MPRGRRARGLLRRSEQRRESKFSVKSRSLAVRIPDAAQPRSKLDRVITVDDGSVVLQFVMVLMVKNVALVVTPAAERSQNVERRLAVHSELIREVAQVLEASFVHYLGTNDLRVADLEGVLGGA